MGFSNVSAGGTLTIPSPNHPHHIDLTSTVRSLMRPLSPSPSRLGIVRTSRSPLSRGSTTTPLTPATPSRSTTSTTTAAAVAATTTISSSSSSRQSSSSSQQLVFDATALEQAIKASTPFATSTSTSSDVPSSYTPFLFRRPQQKNSDSTSNPPTHSLPSPSTFASSTSSSTSSAESPSIFASTTTPSTANTTPASITATSNLNNSNNNTSTPTPFRSGITLSVRSARPRASAARSALRSRISPKSPLKRVLNLSADAGNSIPPSMSVARDKKSDQENTCGSSSSNGSNGALKSPTQNLTSALRSSRHSETSGITKNSSSKYAGESRSTLARATVVSPLKRNDTLISQDSSSASLASPVAKRRSLHGISTTPSDPPPAATTTIFDFATSPPAKLAFDIHDDTHRDSPLSASASPSTADIREACASPSAVGMARRQAAAQRKASLHHRHESGRSSLGRRQGERHLHQLFRDDSHASHHHTRQGRPRLSLDAYVEPRADPLPASDLNELADAPAETSLPPPSPLFQPPRLNPSRPSRAALHHPAPPPPPSTTTADKPPRPYGGSMNNNFLSKSLPPGTSRPQAAPPLSTPSAKSPKVRPAPVTTTGLVSKMHRNPNDYATKGLVMPDTPCKKQSYPHHTYPPPQLSSARRGSRQSFGSPSGLFAPTNRPALAAALGNADERPAGGGLFKQFRSSAHSRKASSLFELDPDDNNSADSSSDFPSTPTKLRMGSKSTANPFANAPTPGAAAGRVRPSRASSSLKFPDIGSLGGDSSPLFRPAPARDDSPKTPPVDSDAIMPPDPSRLSISNHHHHHYVPTRASTVTPNEAVPAALQPPTHPSTPVGQPLAPIFGPTDRRQSVTPVNGYGPDDIDEYLVSRFDKTEPVGRGEFSRVYKVTKSRNPPSVFAGSRTRARGRDSRANEIKSVYAVKKIRLPFCGQRDRQAKLQEVQILKSLSHCPHVLRYVDSWEHNSHLYIQTDYYDEGTLEHFLQKVGKCGRLDDFRIWKIMIELTLGLQEIHDAGFIHLDLKPANVMITFEGVLKIADFGMATTWPALHGIDREGDRLYIAPEILKSKPDKPSDIYSLGLIVMETACNVVLPENGPAWVSLRSGELASVVKSLTSPDSFIIKRDASGMPVTHDSATTSDGTSTAGDVEFLDAASQRFELSHAPDFMLDPAHPESLDHLVSWILSEQPANRPTADQILQLASVHWVASRRRCGATIYEGAWGPEVSEADVDAEMTDV